MPAIGVDVGGTKCLAIGLGDDGRILTEHRIPTPRRDAVAMLDGIVLAVTEVRRAADLPQATPLGVGVPGMVDGRGVLRFAPNLPGILELEVRDRLSSRLGVFPRVENDATCAAWGERVLGGGDGCDHMLLVTIGTGIGGGIVSGGALVRGAHGFAGEIGHMIVSPNGLPCPCGQRGCWERYASGSGLGRVAREAAHAGQAPRLVELAGGDPEDVRGEHVTAAATEGDPAAEQVMARFGWWVALGLANLANLLDPERFVLGGGLIEAGDIFLNPVRAAFLELVEAAEHRPAIDIVAARLGERAGALGAAALAREEFQ